MSQLQGLALVGDVGGTNARLSLVNLAEIGRASCRERV